MSSSSFQSPPRNSSCINIHSTFHSFLTVTELKRFAFPCQLCLRIWSNLSHYQQTNNTAVLAIYSSACNSITFLTLVSASRILRFKIKLSKHIQNLEFIRRKTDLSFRRDPKNSFPWKSEHTILYFKNIHNWLLIYTRINILTSQ
jgi:hypothetical protein